MENEKTVSHLNSKIWYRLIKVIYFVLLLVFLVIPPTAVFYSYGSEYDQTNSYIKCANGKVFYLSENGFYIYNGYMSDSNKASAKNLCFDGVRNFVKEKIGTMEFLKPQVISETESSGGYELVNKYTNRNWFATVGFSILSIAIVLLVFELVRRIFYYVVLGKINPKN